MGHPPNEVSWSDELFRIYGLEPGSVDMTYQAYLEARPSRRTGAANIRAALEGGQAFEFEETHRSSGRGDAHAAQQRVRRSRRSSVRGA